jgi:ribosomal protein L14E/L6E/L27E
MKHKYKVNQKVIVKDGRHAGLHGVITKVVDDNGWLYRVFISDIDDITWVGDHEIECLRTLRIVNYKKSKTP